MFERFTDFVTIGTVFFILWEIIAIFTIVSALMKARSAAGAWGWGMAMLALPFIAVPLYWVFGRQQFQGYIERFREVIQTNEKMFDELTETLTPHFAELTDEQRRYGGVLEKLSERRWTKNNEICLLINGEDAFDSIFEAIRSAKNYVLVQFFIVKDDDLGHRFRVLLEEKAREGVRVYFVYDEIGSHALPRSYVESVRSSGAVMRAFHSTQGPSNRFQINFRNHRKIVVVDGRVGFVGGLNVADEYLGKVARFGAWRDTHVKITGPAVLSLQMVFLADYYWAARDVPELVWTQVADGDGAIACNRDAVILTLPTGPVDAIEGGTIFFLNAITRARRRIWIASPYFVTDESVRSALQMAALRGVDVRLMLPEKPDKYIPWLASFAFLREMDAAGVKVFRYKPGFLHQKVILVDEEFSSVGTANLDNRSMRLNFEVSAVVFCRSFGASVEQMLLNDFAECRIVTNEDYLSRPLWFRVAVRLARLASPVL